MQHILTEEQTKMLYSVMEMKYNDFKAKNGWNLTEEMEQNYREGIIDFCDALIYASSQITYEVSTIRTELEDIFDEMDNKEGDE